MIKIIKTVENVFFVQGDRTLNILIIYENYICVCYDLCFFQER